MKTVEIRSALSGPGLSWSAPMIVLYLLAATIAWWHDRIIAKRVESLADDDNSGAAAA